MEVVGGPKRLTKAQEKANEKKYLSHVENLRKQRLVKEEEIKEKK